MKRSALVYTVLCLCMAPYGRSEGDGRRLRLHAVYVTTRDRPALPDYQGRVHRMMQDVQDFYRTEMARNGYGDMTFPLDLDAEGKTRVHLVTLGWDFDPKRRFTPGEIKPAIADAMKADGIDVERSYFVAFYNAYWQDGDVWRYDVVYTGSGNAQRGSVWVSDHELLDPVHFVPDGEGTINDRGHRLTVGQFNVKMIGGVAHELGHGLGLPHNKEQADERAMRGRALMGAGNYTYRQERIGKPTGSFLTRAHAFALSLHPLFTRTPFAASTEQAGEIRELRFDQADGALLVSGRIGPPEGTPGIVLYHDKLPTGVNKDYDAFSFVTRVRRDGTFAASVSQPGPGDYALHLVVYGADGMRRKLSFFHTITGESKADLPALRRDWLWAQTQAAFARKDAGELESLCRKVEELSPDRLSQARRFLEIARRWETFAVPGAIPDDVASIGLSNTRWDTASVGWFVPSFDGVLVPDGTSCEPLRSSSGEVQQGLYAHADACYAYDLGGRWQMLETQYGLQAEHDGSVVFVVTGDGRELFRSALIRLSDGPQSVTLDISGIRRLELITEPGHDGKARDWGIWFEPTLKR
ncbi:MAG: hypothetical protein HN742_42255 [Lentisphaerae bacterium]|jgi:hypothetical protein|nr:hypothetical protein [Lentisphaerota bacterium]MBT4818020.1 hypothetical protein [Lentisphaerota bacterium]MBT5605928.1 hypothetical protein [Lentisphaerota bacterium]MBT7058007.1 hypothetical protein [Lentisphaerota bacterium]MBT7848562.1 hypothetical protein [Lentisphaerota bacterium]